MNTLIIQESYAQLKQGYPTVINLNTIRPFTAKVDGVLGVEFGALLVKTTTNRVYEDAANAAAVTDPLQIVGVCEATNVKVNPFYPGSTTPIKVNGGQQGNNMEVGEIAVPFIGTAPVENSKVYMITIVGDQPAAQKGLVSSVAAAVGTETKLELPQFRFTGLSEGGLAVLKKLY